VVSATSPSDYNFDFLDLVIMPNLLLNMLVAVAVPRSTVMVQGVWIQLQ
jgi:hypothetical protein